MTKAKLGSSLFVLVLAVGLFGCPFKKKGADAGEGLDDFLDAATVTVTGTGAKNEKDVNRYAKEEKIADEAATIGAANGVDVKTYPQLGVVVAKLSKGTPVTKIAKYFSTGVLVTFDDPAGGGRLMGWVPPESLATPSTTTTATATGTWKPPVVVVKTDAGATPVADAGGPVAVVDAGAAPAIAASVLFAQPLADGKCPAGFAKFGGDGCRRPCATSATCPGGGTRGITCGPKKFCVQ